MGKMFVNGIDFSQFGDVQSIVNTNGRVIVNGIDVTSQMPSGKQLDVRVEGDCQTVDANGTVTCHDVRGDVSSNGSVHANNIGGDVDANGAVTANTINGSVDANGRVTITGKGS